MQNEIFDKNLKAMNGNEYNKIKEELKKIKELRYFSYTFGKDSLDINIIQKRNLKTIYKNPLKELEEKIEFFKEYQRYPALFFYGLGNGILYKALLQNENHKRIVVFEKEIEIIFITLNLIDFSEELRKGRLILVYTPHMNYTKADRIFSLKEINQFFKIYNLHLHSNFYKNYEKDMLKVNTLNSKAIKNISLRNGNDPKDAMQGIEQFVQNIPKMINHPSYKTLLQKRKNTKNENVAIIVSTGPSLEKQLPLLKKYANKAAIFCADSAYAILAKHNIKPDYVCMMERDDITAECFNNDFKDFDKGITFLVTSLVHKNTIAYLERNKRFYILATRPLPFAISTELDEFGYMNCGLSVAHMNYELAVNLNFKNIVFIGQDLAYAKDGSSHSKGFLYEDFHKGHHKRDFDKYTAIAYGGEGIVQSSEIWTIFREIFENFIFINNQRKIKTYNATEGGARIEGAIEKPFKELCKTLLKKDLKKPFAKIPKLLKNQRDELMLDAYKKIKKQMSLTQTFLKECKKAKNQLVSLKRGKTKFTLDQINKNLDKFKTRMESKRYYFLNEILGPTLYHEESLLAPLYTQKINNESDRQNKLFAWLYAHESLIESIFELVDTQNIILKKAIIPLQDELEKRKLL
ncbi:MULTISPECIES: motility associated factor glycosyltransferase family protein [Campylobacter]|uniref:motility associated factor glycosyltransferase family protein n=1 Tax=Campylobacter TaxID=194 RepID=UPI00087553D4|nr:MULTISPECIES: motility associated factor glycosyltransferase family protein [Campylobacter]EJQ2689064.1 motility associated factor glycosyltransferase family protein [Campylobacter jejuni]OEW19901.1 PseE protein [Campylobacter sp. BCW_6889]OEW28542.1 PseE protein [Campylobacter jejuni]